MPAPGGVAVIEELELRYTMATITREPATDLLVEAIEKQEGWLDPIAEAVQDALTAVLEAGGDGARSFKSLLNGTFLGHPLHAALSDAPVGLWLAGLALDAIGARRGADAAVTTGVIAAVPTALAGAADWHDTGGRDRRVGLVHAIVNSAALVLYVGSIVARRRGARRLGVGLSTTGFALTLGGAYLGGDMVYRQGVNVNRTAWDPEGKEYQAVGAFAQMPEDRLIGRDIEVDGEKVSVVLLRKGNTVLALSAKCAHQGGPLAEGKLIDGDCVECPWHGSTFRMNDGSVVQGPAPYPQPRFDVRVREGQVEVRARR